MKFVLALSFLFAFNSHAGVLRAVYKNPKAPKGYTYLAVFQNTVGRTDYAVVFDESNHRALNSGRRFSTFARAKNVLSDGVMRMTSFTLKKGLLRLIFEANNRRLFEGDYVLENTPEAVKLAESVDVKVEAKFNLYRRMTNPATSAELRGMFVQLVQDLGATSPEQARDFPFPVFDQQNAYYINTTPPNPNWARTINPRGTDMLSKAVLKGKNNWYRNLDEAVAAVTANFMNPDYVKPKDAVFATYSTRLAYEGLSPRLRNAIVKHLRYEILETEGFNCAGKVYTWTTATWVLIDGSTVSYSPGTKCN